ncbi:MAG TPA: PAS domain-containing protein, partial [Thermoanaerobaculia bacterium]|nr:PAS domain-containing protein [Thermoanaerobaculia bacterium]
MQRLAEVGRILDAIDTGFIVLTLARGDTDVFLFSAANRTANALTGLDIAGMAGRLVDEALPGVREAGLPPVYAEVLRTRVPRLIERVLIPSGPMAGQIFRVVAVPLDLIPASADMLGLIFRNVTDEIHAEERLRFQSFLLEVVDAAVTAATPDGRVTFWNPHAEQLYDVPASEAIGRHVSEIVTAEGVPSTMELLRKGERFANQVRVTTRGGRTLLVQLSARPFHGADGEVTGVVGISTDVTERVRAENALRESERRMRALIQAIPDLVVRCSRDGVLLDVSRDLEHIHLAPGMNIRAMTASGLARESMERLLAALEASLGGGSAATAELELRSGDTTKHYEAQFVAAGADEAVAIIRDVTERRCMEMALRAAKTDLERRVRARTAELRDVNEALRAVLDASPLGIVSVDLDGQVRSWNRA